MQQAFTEIHRTNGWRDPESVSGPGSGVARTVLVREDLVRLLAQLRVESVLDAGCGDFNWMKVADLPVRRYVGVDVVPALVAENQRCYARAGCDFRLADVTADALPRVDLILCRDCLVHLPLRDVSRALANFRRSGAAYLLATTFLRHAPNVDIPIGYWQPLNLERALPAGPRRLRRQAAGAVAPDGPHRTGAGLSGHEPGPLPRWVSTEGE